MVDGGGKLASVLLLESMRFCEGSEAAMPFGIAGDDPQLFFGTR